MQNNVQTKKRVRTLDKILTKAYSQRGADMGRLGTGTMAAAMAKGLKIFNCAVVLDKGGYDKGGAYWGIGKELRVSYTKDLTYINFYRKD